MQKELPRLVLSRKTGETIAIGNGVIVEVLKIQGDIVKLGIRAPKEIRVLRGELSPHSVLAGQPFTGDEA